MYALPEQFKRPRHIYSHCEGIMCAFLGQVQVRIPIAERISGREGVYKHGKNACQPRFLDASGEDGSKGKPLPNL